MMAYAPGVREAWLAECCKADIEMEYSVIHHPDRDKFNSYRRKWRAKKKAARLLEQAEAAK